MPRNISSMVQRVTGGFRNRLTSGLASIRVEQIRRHRARAGSDYE